MDEAALQLLTDFAWLQSKLGHTGVNSVLADYEYIPGSQDLRLVRSAIRLAAHTVNSRPGEFAAQLLGRLTGDSPAVATLRKGSGARFGAGLASTRLRQPHAVRRPDPAPSHRS